MLEKQDIICISSIDWDFIWQGHQEIMSRLAQEGNRILFIENTGVRVPGIRDIARIKNRLKNWFSGVYGIREECKNLYVFSPIVLPFPYSRIANLLNYYLTYPVVKKWMEILNFNNPIVWTFLPTPLSLRLINKLNSKVVIYYCIDNFSVSSPVAKKIKRSEIKLLRKSDVVFVTSRQLYNYCSAHNANVRIFPFAVNYREFERARLQQPDTLDELKGMKGPLIGYIGGIHKWIDFNLLKKAADKFPDYSFIFIGPLQTDVTQFAPLKNIYFLGKVAHEKIPYYIKKFDVCIIPYLIAEYTKNVYPTKLNEYLAMGKPVVSTALPEIINFNEENGQIVFIAKTSDDFINNISNCSCQKDETAVSQRIAAASRNDWLQRIEDMSTEIEAAIAQKSSLQVEWRTRFCELYATMQRRILKIGFVSWSIYLLIFYTPFIWFLASPLEISQPPEKADCIVAFAGGVGESGKAGQGYEERVQYVVELYDKGYANNILFSSGYTYIFKEPLVMKALAVSLGIPKDAIILEDKAKNTYENIKFSKEILERNHWNKIILISSPYHMRRVSFVFNKHANKLKVSFAPVPHSSFYAHPSRDNKGRRNWKRINVRQIKGIIHEYIGIIYYRLKGWI